MLSRTTRSLPALIVALLCALTAALVASPAAVAAKPTIGAVALYSNQEFWAARAHVAGATGVAICVSRKCAKAFKPRSGLWILNANALPTLKKGQRREVIVFAVNSSGEFSFAVKHVTVS